MTVPAFEELFFELRPSYIDISLPFIYDKKKREGGELKKEVLASLAL